MGEKVRKSFQIEQSGKTFLQKHIETATETQCSYQNEKVRVVPSIEMAVNSRSFSKLSRRQFRENLLVNNDFVDLLRDRGQSEYVDDSF